MAVRLRAHHLLCMLTHVGKGYSPAFTDNMAAVLARIGAGEAVEIVEGPDDICAPLLSGWLAHCHRGSVSKRDMDAAREVGALLGRDIAAGERLFISAAVIAKLREAFRAGRIRSACVKCQWHALCTAVAEADYEGTTL